ncbi:cytokinesis protein 3 [Mortierella polycephala]|uniref:Cytokinesis protein 3 n=1 Tax=Mortierella polycephala TaxID=41804 RepID=A0A9P6PR11_9FUNG|nr:cytokinesis protein 3 [Mortierella polycephala]
MLVVPSRKNPQAIIGDMTDLDTIAPSSPIPITKLLPSQQEGSVSRRNSHSSVKSNQSRFSQLSSHISQILGASTGRRQSSTNDEAATPRKAMNAASHVPDTSPSSTVSKVEPNTKTASDAMYNPAYAEQRQQRFHHASRLLNPSGPETDGTLSPSQVNDGRHLSNRYSMPNLAAGDNVTQQLQQPHSYQQQQQQYDTGPMAMAASNPGMPYIQGATRHGQSRATGTQSACHLPRRNMSGVNLEQHENHNNVPSKQELSYEHNYSEDSQPFPPGMMPRSPGENRPTQGYYGSHGGMHSMHPFQYGQPDVLAYAQHGGSQQIVSAYHHEPSPYQQQASQQQRGYRHSIANFEVPPHDQPTFTPGYRPTHHSALSLENLAKHNRTQNTLDQAKSHSVHGGSHGRSLNQVNTRPSGSAVFNPYDHQQQHQREQPVSSPMDQMPQTARSTSPSIVIPQPKPRPRSAFANYGTAIMSPTDSSPASDCLGMLTSPRTPSSAQSNGTGAPTSVGTSMSGASAIAMRDQRRKSETARLPPNVSATASTFTARKFSVDAKGLLSGATRSASTGAPTTAISTASATSDVFLEASESLDCFGPYTTKKPKATLIRAFKQIINPRKVAEKDALKNKNEHFAWIEMQKSLRRAHSPEPEKGPPYFVPPTRDETLKDIQGQDPFDVLKRCHVMRDTFPTPGVTSSMLDFGPNSFVQVDKIARNVNQRGPHMTPQLLSQKYLTRPYSKSPLFKLRVLFVWISENIRLEGGPTRDVSGGRYKLGPASDNISASAEAGGGDSPSLWQVGTGSANSPGMFMAGIEEYARGFLQEDSPELAQDVLTSRMCKSGEGFANLFAEMALAAGIEDVGVVKGYIKGPMDVFSKDIPPPNHAWNVVRIDGTYRFIDCCLASPFHPAHYPIRPQAANSFYFLTLPTNLALSHFPLFLTYQYIAPSIPSQVFLQLPFVQPAFFEFGLSLPDFKRRTKLDIKDYEPIEVVVRIDGGGSCYPNALCGSSGRQSQGAGGYISGLLGGDCLGRGCGEGVELKAEVEVMTVDGKIIRKRGLAQVVILKPYQHLLPANQSLTSSQNHQRPQSKPSPMSAVIPASAGAASAVAAIVAPSNRPYQSHHCTGIRIAKIKAVLPPETVVCPGDVRKGVVHIYAGRKAEKAPTDAMPYALALSLPIRHTGTMPKTPLNFVLPHFSPYEFYVKSPQTELLYYPHTYTFCVLSLAAQAHAVIATANAMATESEMVNGVNAVGVNTSPRHMKDVSGGLVGLSSSMAPLYRPQGTMRSMSTVASASAQTLASPPSIPQSSAAAILGTARGAQHCNGSHPYQHRIHPMSSTSSASVNGERNGGSDAGANGIGGSGLSIPRPERLVLRTQTNRLYKLAYDPVRQCHEAQVEVKERGIWECVRMDDGGKSRVGREGTGGVVIASWKCV